MSGAYVKRIHYLNTAYYCIIKSTCFHVFFILLDGVLLLFQILEVYHFGFTLAKDGQYKRYSLVNLFCDFVLYTSESVKVVVLCLVFILSTAIYLVLKYVKFTSNKIVSFFVNYYEILHLRIMLSIYLIFIFKISENYLTFLAVFIIGYLYAIFDHINNYHLHVFVPNFIVYPYDKFSSISDMDNFISKLLLSFCSFLKDENKAKFFYYLTLLFRLISISKQTLIIFTKSYFLMNNVLLNKLRYAVSLTVFLIQTLIVVIGKTSFYHNYYIFIMTNIFMMVLWFFMFVYDPYDYIKIDEKTPEQNAVNYLFIFSKDKNKFFILEEILNNHKKTCGKCEICAFYGNYVVSLARGKVQEFDLFDHMKLKDDVYFKLMNKINRQLKLYGQTAVVNNSYYFLKVLYYYYLYDKKATKCEKLNAKLLYEFLVNSSKTMTETHEISLVQIKLLTKINDIAFETLRVLKEILSESYNLRKVELFLKLAKNLVLLQDKKFKKFVYGSKSEGVANYSHLITAATLFYEELFNCSSSHSGVPLRENMQQVEDIFNLSVKNNTQIVLQYDISKFSCLLTIGGKLLHKHTGKSFYDLFPSQFRILQIFELKGKILSPKEITFPNKTAKGSQNFHATKFKNKSKFFSEISLVIFEAKEDEMLFKLIRLKIALITKSYMSSKVYLGGYYAVEEDIVITCKDKREEKTVNFEYETVFYMPKNFSFRKGLIYDGSLKGFLEKNEIKRTQLNLAKVLNFDEKKFNVYCIVNIRYNFSSSGMSYHKSEYEKINSLKKASFIGYDENKSQLSSTKSSSTNSFNNLNKRNKKLQNEQFNSSHFRNLRLLIILTLVLTLCSYAVSYYIFLTDNASNNKLFEQFSSFRDLKKSFYQTTAGIFTVVCINTVPRNINAPCKNYLEYFNEAYNYINKNNPFNFTMFVVRLNQYLINQFQEKKQNFLELIDQIDYEPFRNICTANITLTRVYNKYISGMYIPLVEIKQEKLYEVIQTIANKFQILGMDESKLSQHIFLLSVENLFESFKYLDMSVELTEYQSEFYNLVNNFGIIYEKFEKIDDQLMNYILQRDNSIKKKFYILFHITICLIVLLIVLLFLYVKIFQGILSKILNYFQARISFEYFDFNFRHEFGKKLSNLEQILTLFDKNPIDSLNEMTDLYGNYQKIVVSKMKQELRNNNKLSQAKEIKRTVEETLRVLKQNKQAIENDTIHRSKVDSVYFYFIFGIVLMLVAFYVGIMIIWPYYFTVMHIKQHIITEFYNFESIAYHSVLEYQSMIFGTMTLSQLQNFMQVEGGAKEDNIEVYYKTLEEYFDMDKYGRLIPSLYVEFKEFANLTCDSLYTSKYNEYFDQIINSLNIEHGVGSALNLCKNLNVLKAPLLKSIYQKHFQNVVTGMLSISEGSYEGIISHLKTLNVAKTFAFFCTILKSVLDIQTNYQIKAINSNINSYFNNILIISGVMYLIFLLIITVICIYVFIIKINMKCQEIFTVKKVLRICETEND